MFYVLVKRLFDICVGLIGLVVLVPLTIIIKFMFVCTKDYGSIFYVQPRIGKNGKIFKILKYRSMIPNAEEELKKMMKKNKKIKEEYTRNKKLIDDPRITKVGRIIRRWSIDEMPQLINVLIGNMSVVGNRPYLVSEKKEMGKYYDEIIKTKPGITGLWQISGHNNVSFKSRLELEAAYAEIACFSVDIHILWRTISAVFGGNN